MKIVIEKAFPRSEEIKTYYESLDKKAGPLSFIALDRAFQELTA